MPIRFRCSSCDRLLSIARRKVGTSVTCPDCKAESVVPAEQMATAQTHVEVPPGENRAKRPAKPRRPAGRPTPEFPPPPNSMPLFERPDFEALLNPSGASMPELVETGPKPALPRPAAPPPPVAIPEPMDDADVVLVSRGNLTMVAVVMVVLVGLAFAAGYIIAAVTMNRG